MAHQLLYSVHQAAKPALQTVSGTWKSLIWSAAAAAAAAVTMMGMEVVAVPP
jgi:hypothetical protein